MTKTISSQYFRILPESDSHVKPESLWKEVKITMSLLNISIDESSFSLNTFTFLQIKLLWFFTSVQRITREVV